MPTDFGGGAVAGLTDCMIGSEPELEHWPQAIDHLDGDPLAGEPIAKKASDLPDDPQFCGTAEIPEFPGHPSSTGYPSSTGLNCIRYFPFETGFTKKLRMRSPCVDALPAQSRPGNSSPQAG